MQRWFTIKGFIGLLSGVLSFRAAGILCCATESNPKPEKTNPLSSAALRRFGRLEHCTAPIFGAPTKHGVYTGVLQSYAMVYRPRAYKAS